jgi:hypothetical protein
MKFVMEVECDNAAFEGDELYMEMERIFAGLHDRLHTHSGTIRDSNGNRVGKWAFEGERS